MVSMQMAPQIRMVQSSNSIMAEKIQTTIVNTIPLWKNQMVLALGMSHTEQAIRAQEAVTNLTNDLLKSNADKLKQNTIDTARATERGIIDLDTIKYTNDRLIEAIDEVRTIQIEGKKNREDAKNELGRLEEELKRNLLKNS
ncbi:toxic anion resistance protein, partial [Finegoldia magna]